jgi:phage baseplate assembly protein W|tara:strand:+ start:346 stop:756 length:411 start_codon:yes stop_codon:yes gene_type:complete
MVNQIDRYININPVDLNEEAAIGVTLPFNSDSVFNQSFTTKEAVKSNLINVLLTFPGERVFEPEFGVGLKRLIFEQNIDEESLKSNINDQVGMYIPEIEIEDIDIKMVPDENTLYIRLTYKFILDETYDSIQLNFK